MNRRSFLAGATTLALAPSAVLAPSAPITAGLTAATWAAVLAAGNTARGADVFIGCDPGMGPDSTVLAIVSVGLGVRILTNDPIHIRNPAHFREVYGETWGDQ